MLCAILVVFTNWLPNPREASDNAAGGSPTPLNWAVWGEFDALSVTVSVPGRTPSAVGVKVTEMVQLARAPNVFGDNGHVEVCAKSPDAEIPETVRGAV
jgi:hypothetical protein